MKRPLLLIGLGLFAWGIGEGIFFYFIPIYLDQLGANPAKIGAVIGGFGFMMMIAHIPAGYLSDRVGRRPLIRAAWVIGMIATWMMALARGLPFFTVGYLLYGLTAFVSSPLFSYVTAARGEYSAGRAMTLTSAMFNVGMTLGPLIGGWIGKEYGLRATFLVSASFFVVSSVLIFLLPDQPRENPNEGTSNGNLFSNARYLTLVGVIFLSTFAMILPQSFAPLFLQEERGISVEQIGWIGSIGSLGNVAFNMTLGALNARLGFILGQLCAAAFALLLLRGEGLPLYAVGYFIYGGFRAARMLAMAQIRWLVDQAQMGLAYGISETFSSLAMIVAPLAAGIMYDKDPSSIFVFALMMIGVSVIVTIIFAPRSPSSTVS